jgi:ribosomal protein S18 acetylase RimI-like enzyme
MDFAQRPEYQEYTGYQIRNCQKHDACRIGEFNKLLELSYLYNPDFVPENIFCAVNYKEEILGVGHLEPHDTWNLVDKTDPATDFICKLRMVISLNPLFSAVSSLKADLLTSLNERASKIRAQYPDKKIRVFTWLDADEYEEINFYLSKGFLAYSNFLVLSCDLTRDIPDFPKPEGIRAINRKMETEEDLRQYHEAETVAFNGIVWSMNLLKWYTGAPEWVNFLAYCEDRIIGSVMTWMISEERSATENIFVLPGWGGRGIAKYLITEALKYLKSQGKSIATLGVNGDNRKAISLYMSLGYRMFGVMLELGYDI